MRIFVTGASGYIGFAVAVAFRQAGHSVLGLVRTEDKARKLWLEEITPIIGDMSKPQSYLKAIDEAEVVVHCAFDQTSHGIQREEETLNTIIESLSHTRYPNTLIYTSGVWVYGNTGSAIVDESSNLNPIPLVKWRPPHEELVIGASSPYLRTVVIRPGCVFGGVSGMMTDWFASAEKGEVAIIGKGDQRWATIHINDLSKAYVLSAEKEINRAIFNICDPFHLTVREMAEAVAEAAGCPGKVVSLSDQEAYLKYRSLKQGLLVDQKVSSERAHRLLGWHPRHGSFVTEAKQSYLAWKNSQHV